MKKEKPWLQKTDLREEENNKENYPEFQKNKKIIVEETCEKIIIDGAIEKPLKEIKKSRFLQQKT